MEKSNSTQRRKNRTLLGTLQAVLNAVKGGKEKQKTQAQKNREMYSMTKYQWYLQSGLGRKNAGWKRKTKKAKANFISNRKVA